MIDLQKANRQMIAERTALLAERDQIRAVMMQRAVYAFGEVLDGIDQLVIQAERGDQQAKLLVARLVTLMERARALNLGIVVPNGQ